MKDERRPICEVVAEEYRTVNYRRRTEGRQPLPSERRLCEKLGFSRSALREGLTVARRWSRRSGHEHDVLLGHAAQLAEEAAHVLGFALGLLVDEGELRQVVKRFDVGGLHAGGVEAALVVDSVVVGVLHHGLQALELQLLKLGARHALDFGIVVLLSYGMFFFAMMRCSCYRVVPAGACLPWFCCSY